MPIFFPDNDNRKKRVLELGSEAQNYLYQAQQDYNTFTSLLTTINTQIAQVYKDAGLTPPSLTPVDIFKAADVDDGSVVVDISKILADIAGLIGTVKYLVPGATKALVSSGAMAASTAEKVIADFTIPLIDIRLLKK
jgi:hypothetical protein